MMDSIRQYPTGLLITIALLSFWTMLGSAWAQQTHYMTTENGFDRNGGDLAQGYPAASAAKCSSDCLADPQCKAYTYVGPDAKCWLKNSFRTRTQNSGMVSGVKVYIGGNTKHISLGGAFQDSCHIDQDRIGSDYMPDGFFVANANLGQCMDICATTQQCRAFTFVSPGIQGKDAKCWLKDSVPSPSNNSCCASGFKR